MFPAQSAHFFVSCHTAIVFPAQATEALPSGCTFMRLMNLDRERSPRPWLCTFSRGQAVSCPERERELTDAPMLCLHVLRQTTPPSAHLYLQETVLKLRPQPGRKGPVQFWERSSGHPQCTLLEAWLRASVWSGPFTRLQLNKGYDPFHPQSSH